MKRKAPKSKQPDFFEKTESFFGGRLMTKMKGRIGSRPLAVRKTMYIVLRSTKAVGKRSFQSESNREVIDRILKKHAQRNYVRILSYANVGNHIHLHIQLGFRDGYKPFIKAITSAIAMHVMKWNRWTREGLGNIEGKGPGSKARFWDCRPYTNVITNWTAFLNLKDYVKINQFEASGLPRDMATLIVKNLNPLAMNSG